MSRRPPKGEYIETDSGNKVSRKAILVGTQNIMLGGKTVIQPEVMIRGDLSRTAPSSSSSSSSSASPTSNTAVTVGRYSFLSRGVFLRPPGRIYKGFAHLRFTLLFLHIQLRLTTPTPHRDFTYMPLRMGDHVFVGERSVVRAATIGSHVHIGHNVVVGEFAIIKDYVRILDGTVVPANTVIPSFSIVAGQPSRIIGEVPEGDHEAFELRELYRTVGNNPQPAAV
ncbi:hypothetical protein RB601_000350 [Gaeumannomyces tritici]